MVIRQGLGIKKNLEDELWFWMQRNFNEQVVVEIDYYFLSWAFDKHEYKF